MPRFYFNFVGGDEAGSDDVGCDFESLDLAYLDAWRSMVRIGADLLLEQKDPSAQSIEITDGRGTVLMTLPFDDVFRSRRKRHVALPGSMQYLAEVESGRRLCEDIRAACAEARATVEIVRATLSRSQATGGGLR